MPAARRRVRHDANGDMGFVGNVLAEAADGSEEGKLRIVMRRFRSIPEKGKEKRLSN